LALDVNDKDAVARAVQAAEHKFGRIDVLVNGPSAKGATQRIIKSAKVNNPNGVCGWANRFCLM